MNHKPPRLAVGQAMPEGVEGLVGTIHLRKVRHGHDSVLGLIWGSGGNQSLWALWDYKPVIRLLKLKLIKAEPQESKYTGR